MLPLIPLLSSHTGISQSHISEIIKLVEEGNTIPFIARYRKEVTGGATDEQLRTFEKHYTLIQNLEARKLDVIRLLTEKGVLTPELEKAVQDATTMSEVEDLYRPFKEKKNTRATKALAKWLEPLAHELKDQVMTIEELQNKADTFVRDTGDEKTSVISRAEAIQGAQDIVAERISDDAGYRAHIRDHETDHLVVTASQGKKYDPNGVYTTYASYSKPLGQIPSYAYLALCRAEDEGQLSISWHDNERHTLEYAYQQRIPTSARTGTTKDGFELKDAELTSIGVLREAIKDGVKRLLMPSIVRELRSDKKLRADEQAINVFGTNIQEMLLLPPVRNKVILWMDPGYRTGCKLAVIDTTGKVIYHGVIYPTTSNGSNDAKTLHQIITTHHVDLIVIGNWTGSRETEQFVADVVKKHTLWCKFMIVSEAWASVYSASELATKEYPDYDVTIRGAINIAQRIQDPLSTYVKIDPKSLGVGQYQHDVDQKLLKDMLDKKIQDAVNRVGTDINTASAPLLQYIAWLSNKTATNLVQFRDQNGVFADRKQLKKIPGIWPKAYEQCVGFLRIRDAREALDTTGIHPEQYVTVYAFLEGEYGITKKSLSLPIELKLTSSYDIIQEKYGLGQQSVDDILGELAHPGLDPRESFDEGLFRSDVLSIDDLQIGMKLTGVVRNIVDFGVFVDIWVKNDGLIHKSQLANGYVANAFDVVSIGQTVQVIVTAIDKERSKVSLSSKEFLTAPEGKQNIQKVQHPNGYEKDQRNTNEQNTKSQPKREIIQQEERVFKSNIIWK